MTWNILITSSRAEEAVARGLNDLGCETYLPRCCRASRSGRRSDSAPLWPGYLAIREPSLEAWSDILKVRGVHSVLREPGEDFRPAGVPDAYMDSIRRQEEGGVIVLRKPRLPRYYRGQTVRVRDLRNPFYGHELEVLAEDPGKRVRVLKEMLGSVVRLDFEPGQVEAA